MPHNFYLDHMLHCTSQDAREGNVDMFAEKCRGLTTNERILKSSIAELAGLVNGICFK